MTYAAPGAPPPQQDSSPGWGQSLGHGAAGIMLLHIHYARAGIAEWDNVDKWAAAATRGSITAHPDACGLYCGAPAVAFALHAAQHAAYASALSTLDDHVTTLTRQRLNRAHERIGHGQLPALREFDLINGLTGIGVYLLQRRSAPGLLRDVLDYLVRLAEPVTVAGETLPGWWTANGPADEPSLDWPGGHGNLGMAHGIAGPLALLALALRRDITVIGHAEAIERICAFLDDWRCDTENGAWWPGMISLTEFKARTVRRPGPQRPSWCYGTPGLTRAQQLAALALADGQRQRRAEDALAGCIADDAQLALLGDASLCHGWAGLIQTTWRAAIDAGADSELAALLPGLQGHVDRRPRHHASPVHDGLLEGMAGIVLARHTTATNSPSASHWDACLLLDA